MNVTSFFIAAIIGVFVGFILKKMLHIGAAIMGATGGAFIGLALYNLVFFFSQSFVVLVMLSAAASLFMAFLSFRYYDKIVILGTSLIGSYSFIRGVSLFVGYFPSEYTLFAQIARGKP
jgi:hypothetical protein